MTVVTRTLTQSKYLPTTTGTNVAYGSIPTTPAGGQGVGGTYGGQTVDITYPSTNPGELRPCAVVVHGGGWEGGTKADTNVPQTAEALAFAGYVVFNVDYRTAGGSGSPYVKIADELADYYLFWSWLQANAQTYYGDPKRVLVLGGSAGGHMALMGAITGNARPTVVVAWSPGCQLDLKPPTSPAGWPQPVNGNGYDSRVAFTTGGASPTDVAVQNTANDWYKLSPYWQVVNSGQYGVVPGAIPFILIQHQEYDGNVPYAQSQAMDTALTNAAVSHQLIGYTTGAAASWNGPHAFTSFDFFVSDALRIARQHIGMVR